MNNVYYKDDPEYPELLRQAGKEAPKQIYCKFKEHETGVEVRPKKAGTLAKPEFRFSGRTSSAGKASIFNNCLSVIGSRRLTSYGKQVLEQLVSQIAASGITIVSGFMYGGDAVAHRAALQAGGRTIAVMPCGIDRIHPQDQEELYQDILDNQGLVISEYEGDMQPTLWTYPRRNRIVAGLSKALLIVEAGEKSGCLITANYAKKFKRKIFVVPGPITSSVSKGSNLLIKQGAEMAAEAGDVLSYFLEVGPQEKCGLAKGQTLYSRNPEMRSDLPQRSDLCGLTSGGDFEAKVLEMLAREPMEVDELSRELGISSSELGVKLSMMQIKGLIETRGSKYGLK